MPGPAGDINRLVSERDFQNQRVISGIQEEPRLKYYAALRDCDDLHNRRVREAAAGADILEFGCSEGQMALGLSPIARSVHGIDISDESIDAARIAAAAASIANTTFTVTNAMETGFPDASFDLVFGSGIIHHLDTGRAMREIHRILRPGGLALFKEPIEGNLILKLYRRATPEARTADEHPLHTADLHMIDMIFERTEFRHFGLFSIGAVPFRGSRWERPVYRILATIDRMIFKLPGLRWQAWYITMKMEKAG